ncbi:hypothetical protein [Dyella sp. C11]|uniref:hypothetical protein n=1 Tax=Dyella sp. C11 TaxID=2126991 RepID=UPI0013009A76|nr:hypothetical protein [Dyella sp. C11]
MRFAFAEESLSVPGIKNTKAGCDAGLFFSDHLVVMRATRFSRDECFASQGKLEPKNFGEREGAAQTRQAEELTRLTRRAAIRGPLPSDQPTEHR